jgi:hypothetical protein
MYMRADLRDQEAGLCHNRRFAQTFAEKGREWASLNFGF